MSEYSYDRDDIFPPDFRDDFRQRYYDRSRAENEYMEFLRERDPLPRRDYREEYNKSVIKSSTRGLYGFGYGSQNQQVDQNDDDMSQLQNIGSNKPNPFNFYRVRSNRFNWF